MIILSPNFIKNQIAHSALIFQRGLNLYQHGAYACMEADREKGRFEYEVDGNYGDYTVVIQLHDNRVEHSCDCPFPEPGCKHTVAVLLDVHDRMEGWRGALSPSFPSAHAFSPPHAMAAPPHTRPLPLPTPLPWRYPWPARGEWDGLSLSAEGGTRLTLRL